MCAVLQTGGKQVRVSAGDVVKVEKRKGAIGDKIELGPLLFLQNEEGVTADSEQLKNSKAVCEILEQGRDKKILVFKKKRRKNYRRTEGHRQSYTRLKIIEITV